MVGVSPDSPESHRQFKRKYRLPFTLIADEGHAIAERYGVWGEKMNFGHKYWGVLRTTFIIDEEGRVAKVFQKVKPEGHGDEVAQAIEELRTA